MEKSVLSTKDVMKELGIGKNKMYEMLQEKKIKAFKIGKEYRIPRKSIEEYIEGEIRENNC